MIRIPEGRKRREAEHYTMGISTGYTFSRGG
jgi:hypothetical protein